MQTDEFSFCASGEAFLVPIQYIFSCLNLYSFEHFKKNQKAVTGVFFTALLFTKVLNTALCLVLDRPNNDLYEPSIKNGSCFANCNRCEQM